MELLDIINETNELTGNVEDKDIIHEKGIWHREITVWVMNKKGEILLQKRAMSKKQNPGKWGLVAGHVKAGESPKDAAKRETQEEIGIDVLPQELEFITCEKMQHAFPEVKQYNQYYNYVYFLLANYKIEQYTIQTEELSMLKYETIEEFVRKILRKDKEYVFNYDEIKEVIQILIRRREKVCETK